MLENIQGDSRGSIPPLHMPGFLPHDLCHEWNVSRRLPAGEGNGNPLQCSCLENPRDGGAWWAAVCGVAQSWTQLKRLSSSNSLGHPKWLSGKRICLPVQETRVSSLGRETPWRRKCQPTPVFLPRKSYGQRSLAEYSPWGHKRSRHDLVTKQQ